MGADYLRDEYMEWQSRQPGQKGKLFSKHNVSSYERSLRIRCKDLKDVNLPQIDLFHCTDAKEFSALKGRITASVFFTETNSRFSGAFNAALEAYERFLQAHESSIMVSATSNSAFPEESAVGSLSESYGTLPQSNIIDGAYKDTKLRDYEHVAMSPIQKIYFGAPGTGKSFIIKTLLEAYYIAPDDRAKHCVRVTFHPDYDYSDFIGTLRPVRNKDTGQQDFIFVPGPMTRIIEECFNCPEDTFFLIIEEINRGNAPAIFGDSFQLLDRNSSGESEYKVHNEEVAAYLKEKTRYREVFDNGEIWFPSNLSILCSMNTADQNVFVLDTAFTRRFDREYVRLDFDHLNSLEPSKKKAYMGEIEVFSGDKALTDLFANTELAGDISKLKDIGQLKRNWSTFAILVNRLIDIVNDFEGTDQISEDKKLGPFFVSETDLLSKSSFINKVVYYLKQDVFRYSEQYFNSPFQKMFDEYIKETGDLFTLLKGGE